MTAAEARSRRSASAQKASERSADRSRNIAQPKYGPQTMIRQRSGENISGRPDEEERRQLAATVGARLRELRREYGLSVRDLERRSGVNRCTISRLEHGQRRPRPSVLGWLAWGLVGPDRAEAAKTELCNVAGDSLVAESRWSERSHARRAWRRLLIGGMELPGWLVAPYAVAVLGEVMPERIEDLRKAQTAARAGNVPWPEGAAVSLEALLLADELDRATLHELRVIGRAMAAADKAARERAGRKRHRELRAELGLTGVRKPRPRHIPWKPPEHSRRHR